MMTMEMGKGLTLLNAQQVANRLGIGKRTLWRWLSDGNFPNPVRLSRNCVRWREEDIAAYLNELQARHAEGARHG